MADAIFISYRRDDSEGEAGRLFDDLTRAFGSDAVFMDVAGIKPGVDFRRAIEDNVASCGVLLAVVGRTWATITNEDGKRRIEDPSDFVALEIASALKREVPVIPVLVHDAKMPAVDLLPESLKSFAYHNSVELSHARWSSDAALLIEALKQYVTPKPSAAEAPVHANVPVQLPAPHPPRGAIAPAVAKNWRPAVIAALAVVLLIVGIIAYFLRRPGPDTAKVTPGANTVANPTPDPAKPVVPAAVPVPAPEPNATPDAPAASNVSTHVARTVAPDRIPAPGSEYVGTWKRPAAAGGNDALGKLIITASGSSFTVHAFGGCQDAGCDWGSQPGALNGSDLVATFTPPPSGTDTARTAVVTAHATQGGLDVLVRNTFQNPAGSRTNAGHRFLVPAQ